MCFLCFLHYRQDFKGGGDGEGRREEEVAKKACPLLVRVVRYRENGQRALSAMCVQGTVQLLTPLSTLVPLGSHFAYPHPA